MKSILAAVLVCLTVLRAGAATPYAQSGPLALSSIHLSQTAVPRDGRLSLRLALTATYDNPFDPAQIDVHADFRSPQGHTVHVNGFLNQNFTRHLVGGYEHLAAAGPPFWDIRFAPDAVGIWQAQVSVHDRTGTVTRTVTFRVLPSASPGFLRRSRRNPAGFSYADGKPFFAIGENMAWGNGPGTYSYDQWLPALHTGGGNWIRLWMDTWCALEWPPDANVTGHAVPQAGLGVYNLGNAWRIDTILQMAAQNHINVMLCLGTYSEFTTGGFFGEGQWKNNPYNAANGGPCPTPADFWTNPTARQDYRMRLRYIAARYGYYSNLHAWELWNETNAPAPWVAEMTQALKGTGPFAGKALDPYHHLITTTYGSDAVWSLPGIDFTQAHSYGTGNIPDHAPVIRDDARQNAKYHKPHLMAEFGIDWRKSDAVYDPHGLAVNWHNGLWAAALSGDAGGAMLWWWDNYVAPEHLYGQLTGLSRFAHTIDWNRGPWQTLRFTPPQVLSGPETFSNLNLTTTTGWGKSPADFILQPTSPAQAPALPGYLYSSGKPDLRTTPTFHVQFVHPGRFLVHVDTVSNTATLHILLDGTVMQTDTLNAAPPADSSMKPGYVSTQLEPQYGVYLAKWDTTYGIDVPPGRHAITLDVAQGDWLHIDRYTLTGYRSSRDPDILLVGLRRGKTVILWAQNAQHNWENVADGIPILPIAGAATTLKGIPAGRYQIAWWDSRRGIVTHRDMVIARAGTMPLKLPTLTTDVAAEIYPATP